MVARLHVEYIHFNGKCCLGLQLKRRQTIDPSKAWAGSRCTKQMGVAAEMGVDNIMMHLELVMD